MIGKSYAMVCLPAAEGFPRLEILKAGDSTDIELFANRDPSPSTRRRFGRRSSGTAKARQ